MKKLNNLLTLAIAGLMLSQNGFSAAENILFQDDFNSSQWKSDWESKQCCQQIIGGWLSAQDTDGWPRDSLAVVHDADTNWKDYTVSLMAQFAPGTSWQHFNILLRTNKFLRSSAGTSGSAYQLEFWGTQITLNRNINGVNTELVNKASLSVSEENPMRLKVVLNGGRIQLWIDGTSIFDVVDPNPLIFGGVGLHTVWEAEAKFDDIVVTDNAGSSLSASIGRITSQSGSITCTNLTTGNAKILKVVKGTTSWDCEKSGLIVNRGDKVQIKATVNGIAK